MAKHRAAFFFGSGISYRSGAPNVDEITDAALDGEWEYHSSGTFVPGRPKSTLLLHDDTAERVQKFLRLLEHHITPHLRKREGRRAHYEDLYYAALQIWQDEVEEYVNPMIGVAVAKLKRESRHLLRSVGVSTRARTFMDLARCAADLIQWAAYDQLCRATKPVEMDAISAVAKAVDELDIFSLNHDLLIEAELRAKRVRFADGFTFGDAPVREFDGGWDKAGKRVRLFKLHGSINWYQFTFPRKGNIRRHRQYAVVNGDPAHIPKASGGFWDLISPHPLFLTGTIIKEQTYGVWLTGELFARLRHRLAQHRTLICCGYGWGDKGINMRLNQWLDDQPQNKIVLLQARDVEKVQRSRFWATRWEKYRRKRKLVVLKKFLGACSEAQLRLYYDEF